MRGDSGFVHKVQDAMDDQDAISQKFPAVIIADSHRLHTFQEADGHWAVWLNTEVDDFDGLCIATGETREAVTAQAIRVLESALEELRKPLVNA